MLIATVVTLILMGLVVTFFGVVSETVAESRALIQTQDQVRAVRHILQTDLGGITAPLLPPLRPEQEPGYLEFVEGPVGPLVRPSDVARISSEDRDRDGIADPDVTASDTDDVLMFTTRNLAEPFVGRYSVPGATRPLSMQSHVAEVCWFVRGNTLYRRVLLVQPQADVNSPLLDQFGYYELFDISARQVGGTLDRTMVLAGGPTPPVRLVANSLGDLTKRENRYGHQPYVYPHDVRFWGPLRLPTLRECAARDSATPATPPGLWPFPLIESLGPSPPAWTYPGGSSAQPSSVYADPKSRLIVPGGLSITGPGAVPSTFPFPADSVNFAPGLAAPYALPTTSPPASDLWTAPYNWTDGTGATPPVQVVDPATGTLLPYADYNFSTRFAEDVVLNNVLAFDVKVWDPDARILMDAAGNVHVPGDPLYLATLATWFAAGQPALNLMGFGAYVDLNYLHNFPGAPAGLHTTFSGPGYNPLLPMTYDTWSDHYERDGFDQNLNGLVDEGTDGLDNDGANGADDAALPEQFIDANRDGIYSTGEPFIDANGNGVFDYPGELEARAPYPVPLRGIQIKIRVFEPDSRQIREVTVVQEFLPE